MGWDMEKLDRSKPETSMAVSAEQPTNIYSMSVTLEVSKPETSISVMDAQLKNILGMAVTLAVLKPETSGLERNEQ